MAGDSDFAFIHSVVMADAWPLPSVSSDVAAATMVAVTGPVTLA